MARHGRKRSLGSQCQFQTGARRCADPVAGVFGLTFHSNPRHQPKSASWMGPSEDRSRCLPPGGDMGQTLPLLECCGIHIKPSGRIGTRRAAF